MTYLNELKSLFNAPIVTLLGVGLMMFLVIGGLSMLAPFTLSTVSSPKLWVTVSMAWQGFSPKKKSRRFIIKCLTMLPIGARARTCPPSRDWW